MEKKGPLSENDIEKMLRMHFLDLEHVSPKNETTMDIVAQHVAGKKGFAVYSGSGLSTFFKWGLFTLTIAIGGLAVYFLNSTETENNTVEVISTIPTSEENPPIISPDPDPAPKQIAALQFVPKQNEEKNAIPSDSLSNEPIEFKNEQVKIPTNEIKPSNFQRTIIEEDHIPNLSPEEIKETQKFKKKMIDRVIKRDKNYYALIPSGTISFRNDTVSIQSFLIRTHEITNLEYRTFLFDLLIQGKLEDFKKARPVHRMWTDRFGNAAHNEPMEKNYFSHPAYDLYPVVNITREGAKLFCDWLTISVNETLKKKEKPLMNDFRLPFDSEWAMAAYGGRMHGNLSTDDDHLKNEKGCYLINFSDLEEVNSKYDSTLKYWIPNNNDGLKLMQDGAFHTARTDSYNPNKFGLYCMSGNVSEMVIRFNRKENKKVPGTIGGSWLSPEQFLRIEAPEEWGSEVNGPSPMIGFRPVMTIR